MNSTFDFETSLEVFGFICIFYVIISIAFRFILNVEETTSDPELLYKSMDKINIIGGLGIMTFLYISILHHNYPQIAILSLSFIFNIFKYYDRHQKLKQEG